MKTALLVLSVLLLVSAPFADAAFYEWTDANGVIHLTDSRDKIPKKYLKKARKLEISEEPAAEQARPPQQQAPSQVAAPQSLTPGGYPEQWWRQRYYALRSDLAELEKALAQKQVKLAELQRTRAIFTRIRDREAVNAMETQVAADETRISELRATIQALDLQATKAGVPAEWRR